MMIQSIPPTKLAEHAPLAPREAIEGRCRSATLDVGVLQGLLDFERRLGKRVLPGMFEILERHLPPSCARIRAALGEGDSVTVRQISHKLKSSARCLGLPRLGEVCARLELSAADGCLSGSEPRLASIEEEYEQAASALRRFLGG